MKKIMLVSMMLLLMIVSVNAAFTPKFGYFSYLLRNVSNNQLYEGNLTVVSSFYDAVSGGSELASQTNTSYPITNGTYGLVMDNVTGFSYAQDLWLQVSVAGQAISPRMEITPVLQCLYANSSGAVSCSNIEGTADNVCVDADTTYSALSELSNDVGFFSDESNITCTDIVGLSADLCDGGDSTGSNTNAATECAGDTTYYDGEGNCDDISGVYVQAANWTTIDNYPAACGAGDFVTTIGDTLTCDTPSYTTDTFNTTEQMINAVNRSEITIDCSFINFSGTIGSAGICDGDDSAGAGTYDLNITSDSGSGSILDSEEFTIAGGANCSTSITGNTLTIDCLDTDTDTNTNANTECAGDDVYYSGDGNCINVNNSIDDRDSDTTYSAGTGLSLATTTFSLLWTYLSNFTNDLTFFDQESNLTDLLDDNYLDESGDTATVTSGFALTSTYAGNTLFIDQNAASGTSTSTGGAIRLDNTGNTDAGLIIYSNIGDTAEGRLVNIMADNAAFDQAALHIDYDGTANALEVVHSGHDSSSQAFNVVSYNEQDSAFTVTSNATGKGVAKIVHTGYGDDGSSSAISIDLQGTGTAAQGIFIDSTTGGTTGSLVKFRNDGVDEFIIGPDGNTTVFGMMNVTDNIVTENIYLENDVANHRIYDNTTCIIIEGDTATLEIC